MTFVPRLSILGPMLAVAICAVFAAPALAGHLPLVQQQLNQHRLTWQAAGAVDYDFNFQRICFCGPDDRRLGLVYVRGGQIASVEYPDTGDALDTDLYRTVGDMFDEAQRALDDDAIEITLEYDPALSYPTALFIDFDPRIADEETNYRASGLTILPRRPADLTGEGYVDFDDLTLLLSNWDQEVGAASGNLVSPLDTPVNFQDLTLLLAQWTGPGPVGSPEAALGAEAVPEPASLVLAVIGLLGVCCRRWR